MKGIIMEISEKYAIVLTRQGQYLRVKNKPQYQLGMEIEISKTAEKPWVKYIPAAAMFVFCIGLLSFLIYASTTPYSYVNLDINPSLEIAVNRFDYIIDIKAMNEDGKMLIKGKSLIGQPFRQGVGLLLQQLEEEKYLEAEGQKTLLFTIVSEDSKKIREFDAAISDAVSVRLQARENLEAYIIHTNQETRRNAARENVSSGRYLLLQELEERVGEDVDPETLRDTSVNQLVRMVREKSPELVGDERQRSALLNPVPARENQRQEEREKRQREDSGRENIDRNENRMERRTEND